MKHNRLLYKYLTGTEAPADRKDEDMPYHRSWDWIISIVEKIEKEGRRVSIELNYCIIYEAQAIFECHDWNVIMTGKNANSKIEAVYNACVEYIKQKNNKL